MYNILRKKSIAVKVFLILKYYCLRSPIIYVLYKQRYTASTRTVHTTTAGPLNLILRTKTEIFGVVTLCIIPYYYEHLYAHDTSCLCLKYLTFFLFFSLSIYLLYIHLDAIYTLKEDFYWLRADQ